jgi:antitoxin component of MazEF toxin-antitoxin module
LVQIGQSLAVTLPAEVVKEFELQKGESVEVSIHPKTGAVTIRPGVKYFEDGKVTTRFDRVAEKVRKKYDKAFEKLAK